MISKLIENLHQSIVVRFLLNKIYRFLVILTMLSLGLTSYAYLEKQETTERIVTHPSYDTPQKQ